MELQNTFNELENNETEFLSGNDSDQLPGLRNVFILTILGGYFLLVFFVIISFLFKMVL
jgi:CHASE3 domain sensor protein